MSDRNYDEALTDLLPPGPAWTRVTGSPGSAVLSVGATELARIDAIAMGLVKEADPRTCTDTLQDWLRVYGLPNECLKGLDLTDEQYRQVLLLLVRRRSFTSNSATFLTSTLMWDPMTHLRRDQELMSVSMARSGGTPTFW